jgi:hypothetical protein
MAEGYTAFMTYMLVNESGSTEGNGNSRAIHCNYINSVQFPDLVNKEFNIFFDNVDEFRYLSTIGGTGYTAHRIHVLTQLISNEPYDSINEIKPTSDQWVSFDVTDQVSGYTSGSTLSSSQLSSIVFRIPIAQYNSKKNNLEFYNLDYLNYPASPTSGEEINNTLCFGDETYFMGNVTTSVEAIAYTMDLAINLPLDQFNSSNNNTWESNLDKQVFISEIGLYDVNKNLVGIAKLNNPIPKDDSISRTIVFAMDF